MGRDVLSRMKEDKTHQKMIGIVMEGRAPVRAGGTVKPADSPLETVGSVSSGNYGPSVGKGIALAYVNRQYAKPGIPVILEQGGRELRGITVKTPFIDKF
jgi:aminomethyltransferase